MSTKRIDREAARRAIQRAQRVSDAPRVPRRFRGRRQIAFEMRCAGATTAEIAAAIGYHRVSAWRLVSDPTFDAAVQEVLEEHLEQARRIIGDLTALATRRLRDVLEDPNARDKDVIAAAREVLDRGGLPRMEQVEVSGQLSAVAKMSDDELERLAAEAVDVEVVE